MKRAEANKNGEFEMLYLYDDGTDYETEVREFNNMIERGDKAGSRDVLKRNGGIISLIVKWQHQRDKRNNTEKSGGKMY